jgi:hypothetical protein
VIYDVTLGTFQHFLSLPMNRKDLDRLVRKLGSVELITEVGRPGPSKNEIKEVIDTLTKAIVVRKFVQAGPKRKTEAELPELKDAILKVIYLYHTNEWIIDGNLFALLLWTLHSGSKSRRSKQKDTNKYHLAAVTEAAWAHKYSSTIPEAKLSRRIGVSRTTIRRWREEDEYKDHASIVIDNDGFVDAILKNVK